ncbi:MAG: bifunctional histidinol-phosphatase/imidazoleglycerol-phosphate dehydratase HisB [Calditrichia bacterium]|nr:bifunctional histidinol-phosphatase/imidazoleglycerol-phosphate dehydratase HisB [Calditrichia bacterium]
MKKVLFIDRDGTILLEPEDEQIDTLEKVNFYPGVISNLKRIADNLDYDLVMVSNQDGLGTSSFPKEDFWPYQELMTRILASEGIVFSVIHIDPTLPEDNKPTRKPGIAMLNSYLDGSYDMQRSYVIGDRDSDVQLAKNLGCKSILIGKERFPKADFATTSWDQVYNYLALPERLICKQRKTGETEIIIELNLDGNGKSNINTGIGFFDHMLTLFAKHSAIDLTVKVNGDLYVDKHHSIEDTAILLGEAIFEALSDKKGINRYGFLLPMDEARAEVAIDFSSRAYLVWKVKFKREKIGEMPTELFYHFFKSFSDSARCNLYIKCKGKNEHHKIEAIFKAVARSIRMAKQRYIEDQSIPSTKGVL